MTLLLTYEATKDFLTEDVDRDAARAHDDAASGQKVAVCPVPAPVSHARRRTRARLDRGLHGLYRDEETLQPVEYYVKLPADLDERDAIVLDPMLATGNSSSAAIEQVKRAGARSVTLVCLVSAPEGIEHVRAEHPDVRIVTAAVDRGLNEKGYIVPGLGDAGDRLYGTR